MFNLILTFVAVFMPQVTTTLVTTGVLGDLVEELRGQSGDVLVPSDEVGAFFLLLMRWAPFLLQIRWALFLLLMGWAPVFLLPPKLQRRGLVF